MPNKKIECRVLPGRKGSLERVAYNARFKVDRIKQILDRFSTEDGFDAYVEFDSVRLGVETEDLDLPFCPWSWDIVSDALKRAACCIIVEDALDEFPYYKKIYEQYKAELKMDDEAFNY